jgi:hypothetical protein
MLKNNTALIAEKESEYKTYIRNHVSNVQKVSAKYNNEICSRFPISDEIKEDIELNVELHDLSKYGANEFAQYRQKFYPIKDETPNDVIFQTACDHHYKVNRHHPEHYLIDKKSAKEMPMQFIVEMVYDWEAMGLKFGGNATEWYEKQSNKLILHPNTRRDLEKVLSILDEIRF